MADDNVAKFPTPPKPELLIGPFKTYYVQVEGQKIPLLTGFKEGDKIWLVCDGRFVCGPFSPDEAYQAATLAAQCMAVTAGYPHLGAPNRDQPFASIIGQIDVLGDDDKTAG